MLIDVKCPKCRAKIPVNESAAEQMIDCHGCGKRFSVAGTDPKSDPKPEDAKSKEKDKDRSRDRDRDRDDEPRRKKPSVRSRRDDDDDDDDDRGSRRREEERGSGMLGLLIFGGIGLAVLAIGFGVTAWLIFSDNKTDTAEATKPEQTRPFVPVNPPANNNNDATPKNVPGIPRKPEVEDPPVRPKNPKPKIEAPDDPPPPPKQRPKIEPPPMADPPKKKNQAEVGPAAAAEAPFVKLPAPAEAIAVGGGGKYLFLHLKSSQQIAVFDPAEQKVTKYLPLQDADVVLTAGLEHLIVGYPNLRKIERVPFATFQADKTVDVPSRSTLYALVMGAGAKNPLLAACGGFPFNPDEFFLIDIDTMKRYANTVVPNPGIRPEKELRVWASQDGRTFAAAGGWAQGNRTFQMRSNGWSVKEVPFAPLGLSSDGDLVLGMGQIANPAGSPLGEKRHERGRTTWYFPAAAAPWFCSVYERTYGSGFQERKFCELQLHIGHHQEALIAFPELPELEGFAEFFTQRIKPLDQHIAFFPKADLVAILPAARDKICLRTVNVKDDMADAPFDYLAVGSRPPAAKFGENYRYKPDVLCKKGPPVLRLDAAPVGMKLDGDTLVWTVPTRANQPPANVILTITDAAGQEIVHTFEIAVFPK